MLAVAVKDFKNHLSKYLNQVAKGKPVFITKHGRIVAKVMPYDPDAEERAIKDRLAGSVKFYHNPTDPVAEDDWEALRDRSD